MHGVCYVIMYWNFYHVDQNLYSAHEKQNLITGVRNIQCPSLLLAHFCHDVVDIYQRERERERERERMCMSLVQFFALNI